jgi:ABC-2 type transport system permease protein
MTVATEKSKGVVDRFRSMPMARLAVPFGQTGSDILVGVLGLAIMAGCGLAVGWRADNGLARAAGGFALILAFRYAMSWVGVYVGLAVKNEKTVDTLAPLMFPVSMISNAFVPVGGMPEWLRVIASWNPVSALTVACRDLFGNPGAALTSAAWPLQHAVLATLLWAGGLTVIFATAAVRRFAAPA